MLKDKSLTNKIYSIRGLQVMFDSDLAELYKVSTGRLNEQVMRNIERFPENFMFQLTKNEYDSLISQFAISNVGRGGRRKLPYVFTEQGVAMLSGVLRSEIAVKISIQIINAFVAMRKFIHSNAQIFSRIDFVEYKQIEHDQKIEVLNRKQVEYDKNFERVFSAIEDKTLTKKQGIFFDGQIFDAYKFVSDLIRSASSSIILIDNYIDDSVLTLFTKRNENVKITIFTKDISKQLLLDLEKYNSQYPSIKIKEFKQAHDRFLIIDNLYVYHIGASLKVLKFLGKIWHDQKQVFDDLGKKWFAFCKMNKEGLKVIEKLGLE